MPSTCSWSRSATRSWPGAIRDSCPRRRRRSSSGCDRVLVTVAAFWVLVVAGATRAERRRAYAQKRRAEWLLDGVGLLVQGTLVPLLELVVVVGGLGWLAPSLRGSVRLPVSDFVVGFAINFFVVDYLYYWNHRLLHTPRMWPLHQV